MLHCRCFLLLLLTFLLYLGIWNSICLLLRLANSLFWRRVMLYSSQILLLLFYHFKNSLSLYLSHEVRRSLLLNVLHWTVLVIRDNTVVHCSDTLVRLVLNWSLVLLRQYHNRLILTRSHHGLIVLKLCTCDIFILLLLTDEITVLDKSPHHRRIHSYSIA